MPLTVIRPFEALLIRMLIIPQDFFNANGPHEASKSHKLAVSIGFCTVPFIAVIFLVALGAIHGHDIKSSILGLDGYDLQHYFPEITAILTGI